MLNYLHYPTLVSLRVICDVSVYIIREASSLYDESVVSKIFEITLNPALSGLEEEHRSDLVADIQVDVLSLPERQQYLAITGGELMLKIRERYKSPVDYAVNGRLIDPYMYLRTCSEEAATYMLHHHSSKLVGLGKMSVEDVEHEEAMYHTNGYTRKQRLLRYLTYVKTNSPRV